MSNLPHFIDKNNLAQYVKNKIGLSIKLAHIRAVISILFDELLKDFKKEKELKIHNFGKITLEKRPRKHLHIISREVVVSPGKYIFRFFMATRVKKKIMSMIDVEKTFGKDK